MPWLDLDRGPSEHIAWGEIACRDRARTPYPAQWRRARAIPLAEEFEEIRRRAGGKPIEIGSAYRTPAHNKAVGGAPLSQHPQGRALDLYPPAGMPLATFFEICKAVANERRVIRGIGLYPTFVHVDTRPALKLVLWRTGVRALPELVHAS